MRKSSIIAFAILPIVAIACQRSDDSAVSGSAGMALHHSNASMSIRTTDGAMKLGVANDTVYMGLTDSVLAATREDMARDTEETGNGLGAKLEQFVKKSVSSALQARLKYPLADIDSTRYTNGSIQFFYRNRRKIRFEDASQNNHRTLQSFRPDDAQRFVDTVNNAIRTVRGMK